MSYRNFSLNQGGFSLLASILAMMGLAVMGTVFASAVTQHQYSAVNQLLSTQALYIAEAGFELVIQELLDNQDYSFNGAAADGVVGGVTNVPMGAGRVSVTKGTQTPPVFTGTATVHDVSRVIAMTLDVKNLVKKDPTFDDGANLDANWPETITNTAGSSGIADVPNACCSPKALRARTDPGKNKTFTAYREQTLDQIIPPKSRIIVRFNHMRDRTGAGNTVNAQTLELRLVYSDGSTGLVWSKGPAAVSDTNKGVWFLEDIRGWQTSSTLDTTKVRLGYNLSTGGAATDADQAFGWFDNIQVNLVRKSAWNEQ